MKEKLLRTTNIIVESCRGESVAPLRGRYLVMYVFSATLLALTAIFAPLLNI
jgi:hypothetical protein